jgi:hypothetical protein
MQGMSKNKTNTHPSVHNTPYNELFLGSSRKKKAAVAAARDEYEDITAISSTYSGGMKYQHLPQQKASSALYASAPSSSSSHYQAQPLGRSHFPTATTTTTTRTCVVGSHRHKNNHHHHVSDNSIDLERMYGDSSLLDLLERI